MDGTVLDNFLSTLCGGDDRAQLTLLEWMKGLLVTPWTKPPNAIALVSGCGSSGCGKKAFVRLLERMLGDGAVVSSADSRNNAVDALVRGAGATVVHIDEVTLPDAGLSTRVHRLLSTPTISYRALYSVVPRTLPSYHRILITGTCEVPTQTVRDSLGPAIDLIACQSPPGNAPGARRAHFDDFYSILERAPPSTLWGAVCACAARKKSRQHWKALRAYWQARLIGCYWHQLTSRHMAIGGTCYIRDHAAYEADFP